MNEMQAAELDIQLTYPDGEGDVAGRLVVRCRKSNIIILDQELTTSDLVNLFARRKSGQPEAPGRVASAESLTRVNKIRRSIAVTLPHVAKRFDAEDGRNAERWADAVGRLLGAEGSRVHANRAGVQVVLFYYQSSWEEERLVKMLESLQAQLDSHASQYREMITKLAQS
jgi:hypothetical protein